MFALCQVLCCKGDSEMRDRLHSSDVPSQALAVHLLILSRAVETAVARFSCTEGLRWAASRLWCSLLSQWSRHIAMHLQGQPHAAHCLQGTVLRPQGHSRTRSAYSGSAVLLPQRLSSPKNHFFKMNYVHTSLGLILHFFSEKP